MLICLIFCITLLQSKIISVKFIACHVFHTTLHFNISSSVKSCIMLSVKTVEPRNEAMAAKENAVPLMANWGWLKKWVNIIDLHLTSPAVRHSTQTVCWVVYTPNGSKRCRTGWYDQPVCSPSSPSSFRVSWHWKGVLVVLSVLSYHGVWTWQHFLPPTRWKHRSNSLVSALFSQSQNKPIDFISYI